MRVTDDRERDIDWLMVGRPADFKHPEALIERAGTRMLIGEIHGARDAVERLRRADVMVKDFVPYDELAEIYGRTKTLLVAADLQGGGERAILEARACGVEVVIARENPKLQGVADGPVHDHIYYAGQLLAGIDSCVAGVGTRRSSTRLHSWRRLAAGRVRTIPQSAMWWSRRLRSVVSRGVGRTRGRKDVRRFGPI